MLLVSIVIAAAHILLFTGLYGLIFRRDNLILTMISLEVALLGVALLFAVFSVIVGEGSGFIAFFLLLILAGVESAIGLALVISYYRVKTSIRWAVFSSLKG